MPEFDEALHPRDTVVEKGRFVEVVKSAPEVGLDVSDTEQPLQRMTLEALNRSVDHWTNPLMREILITDPPYQRGSVWETPRRQNLIKSMLLGLPIGAIIVNERRHGMDGIAVIDGKQRIETLRMFVDDEFAIPASWLEPERIIETELDENGRRMVRFSGTDRTFQRKMTYSPTPSLEAKVKTVEEEAEIFRLINTGGVEQDQESLARARAVELGTQ